MASLNRVHIIGNLGQDPELRYTQNKTAVCTLNIATTEYRTNESGEKDSQTTWHRVVVWSKQAENCSKFLKKGRQVYIEGKLQTRQWEDQSGNKRYTTEVVAQNVQFLGSREGNTQGYSEPNAGVSQQGSNQQQGFGQQQGSNYQANSNPVPSMSQGQAMAASDPSLDDIPF